MQGVSILPLLIEKQAPPHWQKEMYYHYYEFPEPHHVYPHFGIRTDKYKLIKFYGGIDAWELYNLDKDPHELHNVYNDKKNAKLISELKISLQKLIVKYKDDEALKLLN